jgi:hypothetical protein
MILKFTKTAGMPCKIKTTKNIKKSLGKLTSNHSKGSVKLKNKEISTSNKKQLNKNRNKLIKRWKSAHFRPGLKLQIRR